MNRPPLGWTKPPRRTGRWVNTTSASSPCGRVEDGLDRSRKGDQSTMNWHRSLCRRATEGRPLRVALIGAGKFGAMFLAQARRTPGIHVVAVVDRTPRRAHDALARVGWGAEQFAARSLTDAAERGTTCISDDPLAVIGRD